MSAIRTIPEKFRGYRALALFGLGFDTADIADFYDITEAQALELVSKQRGASLGLPSGYHDPRPSWPRGRVSVAYA